MRRCLHQRVLEDSFESDKRTIALRRTPLFRFLAAFKPHIQVIAELAWMRGRDDGRHHFRYSKHGGLTINRRSNNLRRNCCIYSEAGTLRGERDEQS